MADAKISALPASTVPLAGTEVLPIVQSSTTKQVSVANLTAGRIQTSNGIVQGTAATGYNFTANTPQAGMTSQLLNWYEEGTFTPTFGNLTVGNGSTWGAYVRNGKIIQVTLGFTWGSTSSIAGTIGNISNLPFSANSPGTAAFPLVVGSVYKAGVGWFNITSILTGTDLVASATFAGTGISSVSPAAFAANDSLTISLTYRSV